MDKIVFIAFLIFLFGCIQIKGQKVSVSVTDKTDLCLFGQVDDSYNAIAKGLPNVTAKWFDPDLFSSQEIDRCKLILLKDDDKGRYAGRLLRQKIRDAVYAGSTLVLYKRAATLVKDDTSVLGWSLMLGDVVPCEIAPTAKRESFGEKIVNGTFIITEWDAATEGIVNMPVEGWEVTDVAVKTGKQLAIIREGESQSSPSSVAIVKSSYGLGQTYYFSYNPMLTPGIVTNIFYSLYPQ